MGSLALVALYLLGHFGSMLLNDLASFLKAMFDRSIRRIESEPLRYRNATDIAIELHETVHPARWCITFADLKHFRSEVHRVLQEGKTFPENFSKDGPSVYAVNEHYIKPVTAAAGKMSWALMMNPDGLDCDLFITHAWQEDVFEFTEKVLTSWPWRARHAWCCMLANPQNLDIGALLQSPSSSPFALALQDAKYMLVLPNRHKSVYTRLWCGYEAYLAFQSNKIVRTATPPICGQVLFSWFRMLLIGIIAAVVSKVAEFDRALYLILILKMLALVVSLVSQGCGQITICLTANHVGLATALVAILNGRFMRTATLVEFPPKILIFVERQCLMNSMLVAYFLIAEIDRLTWQVAEHEAEQLHNQYQGSIRQASCSEVQDEANIRTEIGDQVDEVDDVIQVLLKAGMTSDALRDANLQGVELQHAGVVQLAIPVLVLGPELLLACVRLAEDIINGRMIELNWVFATLRAVSLCARLCFLVLLFMRPIDERCFMLNVMTKAVAPSFFCFVELEFLQSYAMPLRFLYHISFLVVWFFAVLGTLTARQPCMLFLWLGHAGRC